VAKQVPSLELCECLIDTVRYGDVCTGFAQPLMHYALNVGDAPALGFELQRITPTLEDADDVGNARDGADRLENRALDVGSVSAEGNVKEERTRPRTPCEVLDYAALERGLGLVAASHFGTHFGPPAATRSRMAR
jgi:hypothetical protein